MEEHDATFQARFCRSERHGRNDDDGRHSLNRRCAMKTLVTCHAREPMTRAVADEIAAMLHADVDLIISRQNDDGLVGWLRSAFDWSTDVAAPARNLDAYDVIVIGSPAFRGAVASPVRTYIERQRVRLRTVALFTTCGDRGGEHAVEEMTMLCKRDPLARLVVREPDVRSGRAHIEIADFVRRITLRAARRAA
jgi:hypothetical protein